MPRYPHIEQRPWWPEALKRSGQLAAAGESRYRATVLLSEEFDAAFHTFRNAIERGSVPPYPPESPERAAAWASGKERYEGKPCKKHETRTRYTNDGFCVMCVADSGELIRKKQREKRAERAAE